jgi:predicted nucleic acid-binding protein
MEPLFFDTSVFLCAHDASDAERQRIARLAIEDAAQTDRIVISAQVLHEFYRLGVGGRLLSPTRALGVLRHLARYRVAPTDASTVLRAAHLHQRYALPIGDALIVQTALDAQCRVLYSASLPAGLCFDAPDLGATLQVVDPMGPARGCAVHEPAARYDLQRVAPALCA